MSVALVPLGLDAIEASLRGAAEIAGWPLAPGALPPEPVLVTAKRALECGRVGPWHAPFAFVDAASGRIVGSGGFKGEPREGRVEIGYGVSPDEQRRGHATAAVAGLVAIAFAFPEIREVFAETAAENVPSQRVLEKAGFRKTSEHVSASDGPMFLWTLPRSR